MSILNGNISRSILIPERSPFGEPFNELGAIRERGQIMDTAALINKTTCEELLVAAGRGLVGVYRVGSDGKYEQLSSLEIQADSRQLAVSDGFGYLTARADGLYIVDLAITRAAASRRAYRHARARDRSRGSRTAARGHKPAYGL